MTQTKTSAFTIILPAKDEAISLTKLLPEIKKLHPEAEVIVVNDGSTDNTREVCEPYADIVINHPVSLGNGAAIKAGARKANNKILVFMDADGQHNPEDIARLIESIHNGFAMCVGARDSSSQANVYRRFANAIYNKLASYITGHTISDLTSGFRATYRDKFLSYIDLLPNGFSYPTTITMAFFRSGFPITYIPIQARKRLGISHINILLDGARFFIIIFKVGTLYSPLKIFTPISASFFLLGTSYYTYTFLTNGHFTNMGALLFTTSLLIFLIGLVSEQITQLIYLTSK